MTAIVRDPAVEREERSREHRAAYHLGLIKSARSPRLRLLRVLDFIRAVAKHAPDDDAVDGDDTTVDQIVQDIVAIALKWNGIR